MISPNRTLSSLLPLFVGFLLLLGAAGAATWLTVQQQMTGRWVRHTLEVENRLAMIETLATEAETGQRGYLLTGRERYLAPYREARRHLLSEIDALARQTIDNGDQRDQLPGLRRSALRKLAELDATIQARQTQGPAAALAIVNTDAGQRWMDDIRAEITVMRGNERALLDQRGVTVARLNLLILVAMVLSLMLVVLLALVALRDGRRRMLALTLANQRLHAEIGERTAAEGQVRQLQKMEAVGQLTGGIAHDFNNMLAIIIGSLDMARRRLSGSEHPQISKCIDNATEGAQRAAVLTTRLLAFSRQLPLAPRVLDANKLVGGMSELLRSTIGEPVRIETVLSGGLWRVSADPSQVENALLNLAVNARDAMPNGGRLTIETANADLDDRYARAHSEVTAGQYVMISVTDTGVGMAAETIERAFDPFYTTKGVGKGTGLGLSQVFGFVKQSRGHVKIYSEPGHGTTIKIYLPRYAGTELAAETAAGRALRLPTGSADEVILVVEDEAQVRHMSVDALRELGYTVVHAATPNEALQQFALQPRIRLLFTDIIMPEMTGRQLAELALVQRPTLKVLYMTGYTRNAVVHNGVLDSGINFLAKPFTIEQLAMKVREVLDMAEPLI